MLTCLTVAHSYMEVVLKKSIRYISYHDEARYRGNRDDTRYIHHDEERHYSSSRLLRTFTMSHGTKGSDHEMHV